LITQRTAVLNKDVLTQADCLVILRTLAPQDKEAIQAWVKEQTEEDKDKLKVFYDSLNDLENGEAWVWHPEKPSIYCRIKYRQRETFHATREFILNPHAAEIKLMDVGEFVNKFQTVFKIEKPATKSNGEAIDPKLREELAETKTQLENAVKGLEEKEKENENLMDKQEALLSELAQLNSVKKLRDALLEIIPIQTAIKAPTETQSTNGKAVALNLNHTAMQVSIQDLGVETLSFSTKTTKGQMMYCIVNDLPQGEEGFTQAELKSKCLEHGWSVAQSTMSVELSKWTNQGLLIKTARGYRLPKFVKFEVEKA